MALHDFLRSHLICAFKHTILFCASHMIKLRENERIILTKRKHWFVLFRNIVGPLFLLVLPFVLYGFVAGMEIPIGGPDNLVTVDISAALFTFIGAAWTLIIVMRLAGIWTDYYLDIWIVTNMRVIDMEQKSLFHRQTSTFRLDKIQDVTVEINGIVRGEGCDRQATRSSVHPQD